MPSDGGADPLEGCDDMELLDALFGTEPATPTACEQVETSSAFSKLFMIGGSLFSRHRHRHGRLRGKVLFLSWLNYGSIFCPFTKQFVSLRSPHWSHLVAAGFGIDTRLRYGRRVVLTRPEKLEAVALDLRKSHETNIPEVKVSKRNTSCQFAHWSPSLQQSLGVLLETIPVTDGKAEVQKVIDILCEESSGWACRRIPLSFYDRAVNKKCTFNWKTVKEKHLTKDGVDVKSPTEAFMKFGENYLNQCLLWRTSVLQYRKKLPTAQEEAMKCMQSTSVRFMDSLMKGKSMDLIEKHSRLNMIQFLVPNNRLAYLSLPYSPNISLLEAAVNTIIQAHLSEEIFYCPLEHSVDYNSLMDVEVYRIQWSSMGAVKLEKKGIPLLQLGMHADPLHDASSSTFPLVIISNAHLLSKRAITRLLEQWTRNGMLCSRRKSHHSRGESQCKRELFLRTNGPMRTLGMGAPLFGNIHALFVGYSSSSSSQEPRAVDVDDEDKDGKRVIASIEGKSAQLYVHSPLSGSMFFLEESLVAALRRMAFCFQNSISVSERKVFVGELCDAIACSLISSQKVVKDREQLRCHTLSTNCSSIVDGGNVHHDGGGDEENLLFHLQEACETFLNQPVGKQSDELMSYEQLLIQYPKFATMRVRHELLREYPLSIHLAEKFAGTLTMKSKDSTQDKGEDCRSPMKHDSNVVESRRLALDLANVEHEKLKRAHVIKTTVQDVSRAASQRHPASSSLAVTTTTNNNSTTDPGAAPKMQNPEKKDSLIFEQRYDPCFEPCVLLGQWTRTLLFCAPMAADMFPLRRLLYREVTADEEQRKTFLVVDIDVFHIDYVSYPPDHRCRLFGVRLRYDASVNANGDGGASRRTATRTLQNALAKIAVKATLFPIWTHETSLRRPFSGRNNSSRSENTSSQGDSHAKKSHFISHFLFEELDECMSAAVPNLAERRMFALAMAQRGPLLLTVGTHVVALQKLSSHIARGTWCRVVRFIPVNDLLRRDHPKFPELSNSFRPSVADLLLTQHYFEQQRGSSAVPVLQPIIKSATAGGMETVVLPDAMLVGGYRSLHHYTLPTLQLPLLAPCNYAAASTMFHPLFAHEDNLMEFVSLETRAKAAAMTFLGPSPSSAADHSGEFAGNIFFEDVEPRGESSLDGPWNREGCHGKAHQAAAVKSVVLSALSLFPQS